MGNAKILYLDSYTRRDSDSQASDEIGYGLTASDAIKHHLRLLGYEVDDLAGLSLKADNKLEWVHASYNLLRTLPLEKYDLIFIFHCFQQFPSEVRRIVLERGYRHLRVIGYTHGSHWDPTDTFREIFYPGMRVADLANLLCLDRVLVVSNYFREMLLNNVLPFSAAAAAELETRLVVTGLPVNKDLIERYYTEKETDTVQIVFNHSPTPGKAPDVFFQVMEKVLAHVLPQYDVRLVVTRRFELDSPGGQQLNQLKERYGERIQLGNTLSLADYYATLWKSELQVSTALHESFGVSTLEAMYTRNCCILPQRQSYPEITQNTNLYASEDELLEMLLQYIRDPEARHHMANILHEKSLQYLPEAVTKRISQAISA